MSSANTNRTDAEPVTLAHSFLHLRPDGAVEVLPGGRGRHPDVEGRLVGEARMRRPPPHGGERHPDGDEVLYLISGAIRVALDHDATAPVVVALNPGQACVVPQGVWHRVVVDEPAHLLYLTPGRSEARPQRKRRVGAQTAREGSSPA